MIEVEKIRKALEPWREDLSGRGGLCRNPTPCAIHALLGFTKRAPDESDEWMHALWATQPPSVLHSRMRDLGIDDEAWYRIVNANNEAPDGFARYQAVMAEVEKIRAEQEASVAPEEAPCAVVA